MSGLIIKTTAILLVNIILVQGKKYQKDIYLKDKDHVERYRILYSDTDSDSNDNAGFNIVDGTEPNIQGHPDFNAGMGLPDWFQGRRDNIDQGLESIPRKRWSGAVGVPNWFLEPPGDNNINQGVDVGPGQRWTGNSRLPDRSPKHPGDNGIDEGSESESQSRLGDTSVCQNIKGLPTIESGCCGVQLKDFPNDLIAKRRSPHDYRNRRSADRDLKPDAMITGGMPSKIHHLPWMVRILINSYVPDFGSPKGCGGSIISSRYVLTAAHCVYKTFKKLRQVNVFLSEYDTGTFPEDCVGDQCIQNLEMKVDHVIIHPKFNHTHLQNDVALLRLNSDIPYTDFIRPICLPTADIKDLSDKPIVIAGWGRYNGVEESKLKRVAFVNYVKDDVCKSQYSYKDAGMFCSIGGNGEDICRGDSGGPLMVLHDNRFFLSGVVNGKREKVECGSSLPSLFNNVFYHLEWIKENVK